MKFKKSAIDEKNLDQKIQVKTDDEEMQDN